MYSLEAKGRMLNIDGKDREFKFSLRAIGRLQEDFGKGISEIISDLVDDGEGFDMYQMMVNVGTILDATLVQDESDKLEPGHFLDYIATSNVFAIIVELLTAYGYDMPEPEEGDPNQTSAEM